MGVLIGTVSGLFGAGGGLVAVPFLKSLGLSQRKAHANAVAVIFPIAVLSAVLYVLRGYVTVSDAMPYIPLGVLGSLIGAFILHQLGKKRRFSGETALMYCVWYGFGRAIIETMRTDSLMIGNAKVSFLLSLLICLGALATIFIVNSKMKVKKAEVTYGAMFEDEIASETKEEIESAEETEEEE